MWGGLAFEVGRVAHEMDMVGLHDEADRVYEHFLKAPARSLTAIIRMAMAPWSGPPPCGTTWATAMTARTPRRADSCLPWRIAIS